MVDEATVRSALDFVTGVRPLRLGASANLARRSQTTPAAGAAKPGLDWTMADGIAGFGLAERETHGKTLKDLALKIYVEKKLPLGQVQHPIPKWIDNAGVRVDTDVVEIGKVTPQSNTAHIRPAPPGFSIGRALDTGEAGTFGMVVRKQGQASPLYLLSNSHAIANSGFATVGDAIVQPGSYDGGIAPADTVGNLAAWIPFQYTATGFPNTVDAAIAQLDDDVATAAIAQLGVPDGVNTNLRRGMYVQKMGRTTTLSVALVKDIDLRVPSTYPDGSGQPARVGFADQVLVTFYSAGGDSGSPVLDMDNNVVGLHVAGSAVIGIFCKIANVMDQLGSRSSPRKTRQPQLKDNPVADDAEAKTILTEHEDTLTRLPNVVGLGIVSDDTAAAGSIVAVYVNEKRPVSQLRTEDVIPRTLTSMIQGKKVEASTRVIEVGEIKP